MEEKYVVVTQCYPQLYMVLHSLTQRVRFVHSLTVYTACPSRLSLKVGIARCHSSATLPVLHTIVLRTPFCVCLRSHLIKQLSQQLTRELTVQFKGN